MTHPNATEPVDFDDFDEDGYHGDAPPPRTGRA